MSDTSLVEASRAFNRAAERSTTLYDLSAEYLRVLELLEDPQADEHALELDQELDRIAGKITHKAEAIAGLVTQLDGMSAMRKAEAKRLRERAEADEQHAARLRDYLLRHMRAIGTDRIDTARFTVSIRQNPPSVEVLEEMLVPPKWIRVVTTTSVDKRAILEHVKATGEVPDGVEIARKTRLDIR